MPSAADRIDFAPPRDAGALRSFGLALLVHAALIAALTWGVNWKRSDRTVAFEAELWTNLPQEPAPKLVDKLVDVPASASPSPSPPLTPPLPPPLPEPSPKVQQAPPLAPEPKADIALEQQKKRDLLVKQQLEEKARKKAEEKAAEKAADKAEAMAKAKADAKSQAQAEAKAEKAGKKAEEAQQAAALKQAEDAKKLAKKKQDIQQERADQATAAQLEEQRKQNLARIMGQSAATGSQNAQGTVQTSSGPAQPSAGYGGKVRARVKPNIVFTEDIAGNPTAEVEVRTALDGTVTSQRLIKSSGNKAWDDAVVKAIIRTQVMPRDVDGRVPTPMILEFRPRD